MKYIFLLLLLVSAEVGFAQAFAPNANDTPSGGGLTPASNNTQSGGTFTPSGNTPSGGTLYPQYQNNTYSGGTLTPINGSGNTPSGGRVTGLQELQKPNLTVVGITNWFIKILNYIAILLFTAALVVFLYGIFILMFVGGTNEESRSKGRKFMFWGIVSLFVMTSTWGLVNVLKSSIFGSTGPLLGPQFK